MNTRRHGLLATRLVYFQAVAEHGSVRRAAAELSIAPSSISRSISGLEADLGSHLFERIGRHLRLNSAGEIMLHHIRLGQKELAHGLSVVADLQGVRRGEVKIAVIESVMRHTLLHYLDLFWRRYPGIRVDTNVSGSQAAFDGVADGHYDLAIAFDTPVPLKARKLASAHLHLGLLVPPEHPLSKRDCVRLGDLANERILLASANLTLGQTLHRAMERAGVTIETRAVSNSIDMLLRLTEMGHGITLQTRLGAEAEILSGRLCFVPLEEPRLVPRELVMICRPQNQLPAGPSAMAALLSEAFSRMDERAISR